MKRILSLCLFAAVLVACGPTANFTRESQYAGMYQEKPLVLLVMPPVNNTSHVEAKDLLYTSISRPLAEAGYYVIPPLLAMDVLKAESAYDAELFIDRPLTKFHDFFGADAVVFSQIDTWTKTGFGIETKIRYIIKSSASNEIIFDRSCDLYLDLRQDSGGNSLLSSLVDLAVSAVNTIATEHIEAARMANYYIFSDIPRGKYHPDYLKDQATPAEARDVHRTVKK